MLTETSKALTRIGEHLRGNMSIFELPRCSPLSPAPWHAFWMTAPMFLSDAEIAEICAPLKASAAQKRFLRSLGIVVNEKPNGKPLVVRSHVEWVLSGRSGPAAAPVFDPRTQPNVEGLLKHLGAQKSNRKKRRD